MLAYKLLECGHHLVLCIDAKPSSLKANRVLLSHVIRTATVPLGWPNSMQSVAKCSDPESFSGFYFLLWFPLAIPIPLFVLHSISYCIGQTLSAWSYACDSFRIEFLRALCKRTDSLFHSCTGSEFVGSIRRRIYMQISFLIRNEN